MLYEIGLGVGVLAGGVIGGIVAYRAINTIFPNFFPAIKNGWMAFKNYLQAATRRTVYLNYNPGESHPDREKLEQILMAFEDDALILYQSSGSRGIHVACKINDNFHHSIIYDFEANRESHRVQEFLSTRSVSFARIIQKLSTLMGIHIPANIRYPTQAEVRTVLGAIEPPPVQSVVETAQPLSSPTTATKLTSTPTAMPFSATNESELADCQGVIDCSICLDEFTEENIPYMVKDSGQSYHKDCILQCFQTQDRENSRSDSFTDPKTRARISKAGYRGNPESLLQPNYGYLSAATSLSALLHRYRTLKERLSTDEPLPAAPDSDAEDPSASTGEPRKRRRGTSPLSSGLDG